VPPPPLAASGCQAGSVAGPAGAVPLAALARPELCWRARAAETVTIATNAAISVNTTAKVRRSQRDRRPAWPGALLTQTPLNSAPLNSAPLNSAPLNSAPLNSAPRNIEFTPLTFAPLRAG